MSYTLYTIEYSMWSEMARWALDYRGITYRKKLHLPMLGELPLRIRAGSLSKTATVPLLVGAGIKKGNSLEIARFAEEAGSGPSLFPVAHSDAIGSTKSTANEK